MEKLEFPAGDADALRKIADPFGKRSGGICGGCIGALDGICIRVREPAERETPFPAQYMNRKGFFSLNVQAIADSNFIFRHVSIEASGSTHDWTAWQLSPLFRLLDNVGLPAGFWIAGDEAFVCSEYMLTPFSGRRLGRKKDTFNYYHSNCRIHVEQAFGILVRRWGVFWRRMEVHMKYWPLIIMCCIKLHNVCRNEKIGYRTL
ncbi:MAG: transposase family protein [bacterium]